MSVGTEEEQIDIFADVAEPGESIASDSALSEVSRLAREQQNMTGRIAAIEEELREAKKELRYLEEVLLPEAMDNINMAEFKLDTGEEVKVEPVISASISEKNKPAAMEWLRTNGFGALIKRQVQLTFGKGQDELADEVVKFLAEDRNLPVKDSPGVHPMTLKSWVREQLQKGEQIPEETFGIYSGRKAKVTLPK